MKKIFDDIESNRRQIIETVVLALVIAIPFLINLRELFSDYLASNPSSLENSILHIAITYSNNGLASVIFFLLFLRAIWKFNDDFVMNRKNVYHNYCYVWYWFCANVLRIKKCNLILVPIFMQFKLVIRSTFNEFPFNEAEYPIIENEPKCKVTKLNTAASGKEINLILEDTYAIEDRQIPKAKRGLYTIKISRNDGNSNGRHFSQEFIETTINAVREINRIPIMNVYATTNPMNTEHIAKRVFALGDRGNVKHLYVYQQGRNVKRTFEPKGYKIY
jgi:hypothetical protein